MKTKKFISEKKQFLFLLILVGLLFFMCNLLTPYVADDYTYMGGKSLADIVHKEYIQYLNMNGRSIAHFLARIFLVPNKLVFDIVNTFVFLWLTLCIYFHANGTDRKNKTPGHSIIGYFFIPCALWLFVDVIGQTCLWLVGTCNYMWGATWIMSLLLPYSLYFLHGQKKVCSHWYQCIGLFVLAVIAGWSSENTSGAMIMIILGWIVYAKLTKTKLQAWMFSGFAGSLIGYGMLVFSPGHSARAEEYVDDRNILIILGERFSNATEFLFTKQLVLILLLAFFLVLHIYQKKSLAIIYAEGLFGLAAFAAEYALILSPGRQTDRVTFGVTVLFTIACSIGLAYTAVELQVWKICRSLAATVLVLFTFSQGVMGTYDMACSYKAATARVAYTESMIDKGAKRIMVPFITPEPATGYSAQYLLSDISAVPDYWTNRVFADHYGLESVKAVEQSRWETLYQHAEKRFMNCDDFTEYLRAIKRKGYVAFLAVQDDASQYLTRKDSKLLKKMGVTSTPKFHESYLAIIDDGKCVEQKQGDKYVTAHYTVQDKNFFVGSLGKYDNKNTSCTIILDGTELATQAGGMNIVVYSKEKDAIIDSVTFQLWGSRDFIR